MESYLINWSAPWLSTLRTPGVDISTAKNWRDALNRQAEQRNIRNHANLPLYFIPQHELPDNTAYETHISATGKVPTRDNLHDFFNALVWLTFPKIKAQLNALQAKQIERLGIGKSRGAARDAATLFDENAALLTVTDTPDGRAIVDALHNHQWHQLFVQDRQQFIKHGEVFLSEVKIGSLNRYSHQNSPKTMKTISENPLYILIRNIACKQISQLLA